VVLRRSYYRFDFQPPIPLPFFISASNHLARKERII
jgi:hypothetical protein